MVLLRRSQIAGSKVLSQLLEVGTALIEEALQFLVGRVLGTAAIDMVLSCQNTIAVLKDRIGVVSAGL